MQKERKDGNEVQRGKGHPKSAAHPAASELPGNVVCRNFDLNLLPAIDEDQVLLVVGILVVANCTVN